MVRERSNQIGTEMAKKPTAPKTAEAPKTEAPTEMAQAAAPAEAQAPAAKVPLAKLRGPRGVPETAKISLLVKDNPKRPGSKAHRVFSHYKDGMTVGEFCDAVNATDDKGEGTPNLVYDAAHKFIAIEGYTPTNYFEPKPKAEAKPKEPKKTAPKAAPKTEEQKAEETAAQTAEIAEATETETVD